MKKILFVLPSLIFALTTTQINILKTTYKIASYYQAKDGHKFNDTMCAIILTESSAGRYLIGDIYFATGKEKPFLLKSLGIGQIKLETAIRMILKYPQYFKNYRNFIHKNPFAFKKYVIYLQNIAYYENIIHRYKNKHTKRAKKVLRWAKRELRYNQNKMNKYKHYYQKDFQLAELLLSDIVFNIKIGTLYLITNYNEAKKRHMWNPWFKAISKYNGGWYNKRYYKKVIKNMKIWRTVKNAYINKR
jgi:hypothetical protein